MCLSPHDQSYFPTGKMHKSEFRFPTYGRDSLTPCAQPRHASPPMRLLQLPAPVPALAGSVPCGKATCGPRRSTSSLKIFNFTAFLGRHRGFFPVGRRWGRWFPERQTCGSSVGEHLKTVQGLSSSAQSRRARRFGPMGGRLCRRTRRSSRRGETTEHRIPDARSPPRHSADARRK